MKYHSDKDKTLLKADFKCATEFVNNNETNNTVESRINEDKLVERNFNIVNRDLLKHNIQYHFTSKTNWGKLKELVHDEELITFINS